MKVFHILGLDSTDSHSSPIFLRAAMSIFIQGKRYSFTCQASCDHTRGSRKHWILYPNWNYLGRKPAGFLT